MRNLLTLLLCEQLSCHSLQRCPLLHQKSSVVKKITGQIFWDPGLSKALIHKIHQQTDWHLQCQEFAQCTEVTEPPGRKQQKKIIYTAQMRKPHTGNTITWGLTDCGVFASHVISFALSRFSLAKLVTLLCSPLNSCK